MSPEEIGSSYDKIAERWNAADFCRDNGILAHQRALRFLEKRGRGLDIGCGCSGRFIDLLRDAGLEVEGIDVSARMIELARQRHPEVIFYHDDISGWRFPKRYDFITAWDSIWHLPVPALESTMKSICGALSTGGVFIFTTGGLDQAEEKVDSSMGVAVSYAVLGLAKTVELLAANGCMCRHLEYDQYPEKHVYVIAQKVSKVGSS